MIKAVDINKSYGNLHVLRSLSLEIKRGEVVSVVGASGAGKTTLLQILGTLDRPDSGRVLYCLDGTDKADNAGYVSVMELSDKELARFRNRHIGFVFQTHNLLPEFTAMENVCLPALIAGTSVREAHQRAMELLGVLGLEERARHKPSALSGGEQQRVAVARALINRPAVVLADEPSGNLDSRNAGELHRLFFDLRDRFGQTFIIVTHNEEFADMADRKIVIKDGKNETVGA